MTTPRPLKSTTEAFSDFTATLNAGGLRAALAQMLERTDYRFIGIWRFQDDMSAPAVHVDRLNPDTLSVEPVPATATYCSLVRQHQQPFNTDYAVLDERLLGHPAREVVASYCGIPLVEDGAVIGTLCHYDLVPRNTDDVDTQLMLMAGAYLTMGGLVPPYPDARPA